MRKFLLRAVSPLVSLIISIVHKKINLFEQKKRIHEILPSREALCPTPVGLKVHNFGDYESTIEPQKS